MEQKNGRIQLEGLLNTRDLGGYRTADGKAVKEKSLIRSGALADMTEADKKILFGEYGVRTVIDFRTGLEASQKPEPEAAGVRFVFHPILNEETAGFTHENEKEDSFAGFLTHAKSLDGNPERYIDKLYRDLVLDEQAVRQYGRFLEIVLEAEPGAVLWHCSAGKDRAGVGTALVLTALGVPKETVMADFLKTNEYLKPETEKIIAAIRQIDPDPKLQACAGILCEVRESYLDGVFGAVEEHFGSMDRYLEEKLGMTSEKRNRMREKYLI